MAEATPTVYSYYAPEVREIVRETINRVNNYTWPRECIHEILRQNYNPGLDNLHLPLLGKYERFARSQGAIGHDTFAWKYYTNGSSEGIFHVLNWLREQNMPVYQFQGEYQGYSQYAASLDMHIQTVHESELKNLPSGYVIVSTPNSMQGLVYASNGLRQMIPRNHQIILDLAYLGMTEYPINLDLSDPQIEIVLGSLSKPMGLYYYRVGFCYSRIPIDSLYGNMWFKNALSIKIAEAVLDKLNFDAFKHKYLRYQDRACTEASEEYGVEILPSDVWLLGHWTGDDKSPSQIDKFARTDRHYRFCLTPYFMEYERETS